MSSDPFYFPAALNGPPWKCLTEVLDRVSDKTMNYYLPLMEFVGYPDPPTKYYDKFGGLPWGLPPEQWPICAHCGGRQTLLAQLAHGPPHLDLGRAGRVLYVLQCPQWHTNGCDAFDPASGANACLIFEPEDLAGHAQVNDVDIRLAYLESRIISWEKHREELGEEFESTYYDLKRWHDVPIQARFMLCASTKAGGIPLWGSVGPADVPTPDWRFALQISDSHCFAGDWTEDEVQRLSEMGTVPMRDESGRGWTYQWANFAQGRGYVFLSKQEPIRGVFSWQRN